MVSKYATGALIVGMLGLSDICSPKQELAEQKNGPIANITPYCEDTYVRQNPLTIIYFNGKLPTKKFDAYLSKNNIKLRVPAGNELGLHGLEGSITDAISADEVTCGNLENTVGVDFPNEQRYIGLNFQNYGTVEDPVIALVTAYNAKGETVAQQEARLGARSKGTVQLNAPRTEMKQVDVKFINESGANANGVGISHIVFSRYTASQALEMVK